jgi:hypothetical protein
MNKFLSTVFVLLIIFCLALTACSSDGSTIRLLSRCKMVDVPYETTEEYSVDLKYETVEAKSTTTLKGVLDVWAVGIVQVRNVDSETGEFTVIQTFKTLEDGETSLRTTQYIMPGETKEFKEEYDISAGEDVSLTYQVIPGTKKEIRTVTKYRQEERCE